jgi:hypothetical protein
MIAPMTFRICLLVAGASALLNQAALGCRHYRPSFGETPRASAASSAERSLALVQAAACTQDDLRPTPRALE